MKRSSSSWANTTSLTALDQVTAMTTTESTKHSTTIMQQDVSPGEAGMEASNENAMDSLNPHKQKDYNLNFFIK